jgi:hypothetical protein
MTQLQLINKHHISLYCECGHDKTFSVQDLLDRLRPDTTVHQVADRARCTMTHDQLISLFAWMSAINLVLFAIGLIKITILKRITQRITELLFGSRLEALMAAAPHTLMQYYILILVFNVVPYLVLRFMI